LQQPLQICSIKDRNFDHNKITWNSLKTNL
jgi:hypothetical protein